MILAKPAQRIAHPLVDCPIYLALGFRELSRIPNAGLLKGLGYQDAIQFFYDFGTTPSV